MYNENFPKNVPHQLSGVATIYNQAAYPLTINDEEYANIAFKLAELSVGKNKEKNIEEILQYVKNQHAYLKRINGEYTSLLDKICQWVGWAVIWTRHKDDKPETN